LIAVRQRNNVVRVRASRFLPALLPVLVFALKIEAAESEISFQSPDRKFGVHNFEDGRVELVALPSRKIAVKLDLYGEIEVLWSPDSRRFTACEGAFEDGVQLYEPKLYQLAGSSFKSLKLPDLTLSFEEWPGKKGRKGAHGREFILPVRWVDANTLVLKRECQCNVFSPTGEETDEKEWSLAHEITLTFDSKDRVSIQKITKLE
jgi:hypothetical protein